MNRASRALAAAVLVAVAVGSTAPAARAQRNRFPEPEPQQIQIPGGGTELFRALLDKEGVQPVTARDLHHPGGVDGDDFIVIVIGSPQAWERHLDPLTWARGAVQANGAVLVASDSKFPLYSAIERADWIARFHGDVISADTADSYREQDCPFVVPVSPDELLRDGQKSGPVWGLFRGLTRLATNQPTYIEMQGHFRGEYRYPLARLPKSSRSDGRGFRQPPLFAVGGDGEPQWGGRPGYSFLAVADSSVYINQMIMEGGTDNLEFALRTIEYLQGPGKHRKRCLFFEDGRVIERFDGLREALAKPKPKIPPGAMPSVPGLLGRHQERLIEIGDQMLDQFQTRDGLHNVLVGRPGSSREQQSFGKWLEALLVAAAIGVTLFLLWRSVRARHPLDVPPPPNTGAGAASTGPPGVFDRRQKELVRRNNLYEPVRNLMREFFDSAGAPPAPGPRLPALDISDAVRKPESLRQAIRDMWRLAYGPPQPVSAQRWFELEPYFERLRKAHADGKWRFVA